MNSNRKKNNGPGLGQLAVHLTGGLRLGRQRQRLRQRGGRGERRKRSRRQKVTIELAISKSSQDSAFIQQDLLDEFEQKRTFTSTCS